MDKSGFNCGWTPDLSTGNSKKTKIEKHSHKNSGLSTYCDKIIKI